MHKRTFIRAAGVSPPWVREPDAVPRESNIVRKVANTQEGAAGVSPPWVGNLSAIAMRCISAFEACIVGTFHEELTSRQLCVVLLHWFSVLRTCHGGLTPPALGRVTTTVRPNNDDFCDAQTHIHKSGGCQPAVARFRQQARIVSPISATRYEKAGIVIPPTRNRRSAVFAGRGCKFGR